MTRKQTMLIALLCAIAVLLAALMLGRPQPAPDKDEHASHADSHGHDDRHQESDEKTGEHAADAAIAMSDAQMRANGIAVDSAGPASVRERLHLPAQIKANAERTVALAAPAAGVAQSVLVSVGTPVKKGQPLLLFASPALAEWRAQEGSARARLALAQATQRRERALWEEGVSARQDLDAAVSALTEAEYASQAARQRLAALGVAPGAPADGALLRAPLDGVVVDKPVVAGQAVDERGALLTIANLSDVWVEAALPADSLAQVASGMPAEVSVNTLARPLAARVAFVALYPKPYTQNCKT